MSVPPAPRSAWSTLVALLMFVTVCIGSASIFSFLVTVGPAVAETWSSWGLALPLACRLALGLARAVSVWYWVVLLLAVGAHGVLLVLLAWAGRTPQRLMPAVGGVCFVVSLQLMVLFWLGVSFNLPFLS